jgi:DNA-binding CsgD family transcriptional regulator
MAISVIAMKKDAYAHIKIFQDYSRESLKQEQIATAVGDMLRLPWVKRFLVFSDQAVVLIDMNACRYLYVSPSMKNISGYDPEEFTDFSFIGSIMPAKEIEITAEISGIMIQKLSTLHLAPRETLHVHSTRNVFFKRKNGTLMNALQHGFTFMVNNEGIPVIEMLILTDITPFNSKNEHFYSIARTHDDGTEEVLLSGRLESTDDLISAREQEILMLLSRGYSSQRIAEQCYISVETVKTHRKNLFKKTGCKTSIDLVRFGYAHGWL